MLQVASALNDEIRRLAILVEEFDRPFHPDQMLLNVYKKVRDGATALHGSVDRRFDTSTRLSSWLTRDFLIINVSFL